MDDFLCVLVPFFKELVSDRMGVGIFSILISAIVPLLLRLNYLAISPNRSTALLGFGLPLLVAVGGQLVGIGVFAASVGSAIYALGAWRMAKVSERVRGLCASQKGG